MNKLKIIVAPDTRLNQISENVISIDKDIKLTLDKMLECMYESSGIGLAAPQVGILKRLVVVDCSDEKNKKRPLKLINPEIVKVSNRLAEFEEGCLSLPTQFALVKRPEQVKINFIDEAGKACTNTFEGLEATCIQHEIDHLNGKLFVDHISKLKKSIILKKLQKYKKKNQNNV